MEIEAKFVIPDAVTARRLRALARIGEFALTEAQTLRVRDTFFDTPARTLSAARTVLRVRRRSDGKTFLTLKTPTAQRGAIHRRPEIEAEIPFARAPKTLARENLPPRIYKHIAPCIGDARLQPLVSISQTRHVRLLKKGRRVIGEWSIDRVEFRAGAQIRVMYELEIELSKSEAEAELAELARYIEKEWNLQPQPKSKFARALAFSTADA
jgi:inorganic triphosphatase YgiF